MVCDSVVQCCNCCSGYLARGRNGVSFVFTDRILNFQNFALFDAVYSLPLTGVVIIVVKDMVESQAVRLTRASKQWKVRSTSIPASVDPPIGM